MKTIDEQLVTLTQAYGPEIMLQACKNLLAKQGAVPEIKIDATELTKAAELWKRTAEITLQDTEISHRLPVMPDKYKMLSVEELDDSADDLLNSANELMTTLDDTRFRRAEIVHRLKLLETEIQLKEAEAFMQTVDNMATVDGKQIKLGNAEMRDAYRRQYSAELRKERAALEGELAQLSVMEAETKQRRQDAYIAAECLQRKAGLQEALLKFLARG